MSCANYTNRKAAIENIRDQIADLATEITSIRSASADGSPGRRRLKRSGRCARQQHPEARAAGRGAALDREPGAPRGSCLESALRAGPLCAAAILHHAVYRRRRAAVPGIGHRENNCLPLEGLRTAEFYNHNVRPHRDVSVTWEKIGNIFTGICVKVISRDCERDRSRKSLCDIPLFL